MFKIIFFHGRYGFLGYFCLLTNIYTEIINLEAEFTNRPIILLAPARFQILHFSGQMISIATLSHISPGRANALSMTSSPAPTIFMSKLNPTSYPLTESLSLPFRQASLAPLPFPYARLTILKICISGTVSAADRGWAPNSMCCSQTTFPPCSLSGHHHEARNSPRREEERSNQ